MSIQFNQCLNFFFFLNVRITITIGNVENAKQLTEVEIYFSMINIGRDS